MDSFIMKRRQTVEHLGRVLDFYLEGSLNNFGRCAFLSKHEVHYKLHGCDHVHSLFYIFNHNCEI